jgi:hypothetical protein
MHKYKQVFKLSKINEKLEEVSSSKYQVVRFFGSRTKNFQLNTPAAILMLAT